MIAKVISFTSDIKLNTASNTQHSRPRTFIALSCIYSIVISYSAYKKEDLVILVLVLTMHKKNAKSIPIHDTFETC